MLTGISSGIGKATLEAAVAAGYHVFGGDRATRSEPAQDDADLTGIHLDITKADDIAAAVATIAEHVGDAGLDGLANIAGVGVPGPLETMPMDRLRFAFDVDVFGQMALTQPLIPLLRRAGGRIVFIGSIADRTTIPFMGALSAPKAAIASLSGALRQELAPWGIGVILVEPGFITTGADTTSKKMIDDVLAHFTPEQADLYGSTFKEMSDRGYRIQTTGSAPEGVAAVILEAFTAAHPHDHYLTGSKAHLVAALAKLPTGLQDDLKRTAFGLPAEGSMQG
jgi:NAD(P)-dependent dehydrogenase (short-subunit alcohol dehydrogenase family)